MSDWILGEANKIKSTAAKAHEQAEAERQRQEIIRDHWPDFWPLVRKEIAGAVALFNQQFPEQPSQHMVLVDRGTDVTVSRPAGGFAAVMAFAAANGIHVEQIREVSAGAPEIIRARLDYGVIDGVIGVSRNSRVVTQQGAAELILKALFPSS